MAAALASEAIAAGFDKEVARRPRPFFYMPFMHSERIADQERSVLFFHALGARENLRYARDPRSGSSGASAVSRIAIPFSGAT